jgi:hypothetical protein
MGAEELKGGSRGGLLPRDVRSDQMAGSTVARRDLAQQRNLDSAALYGNRTAVVKTTTRRRIAGIGNIALDWQRPSRLAYSRDRHRCYQGLRVGVLWRLDDAVGRAILDERC